MNTRRALIALAAASAAAGYSSVSSAEGVTKSMDFNGCLLTIRKLSQELSVAPINIVETENMRVVKFLTTDGSVLVTCSGLDQTMTTSVVKY